MSHISPSIEEVNQILKNQYNDFAHHNLKNPLRELLFILCSTRTQEGCYRNTYKNLRQSFPRVEMLVEAPEAIIADAISSGGLQRQKAKAIKQIGTQLNEIFGRPTLSPLKNMSDEECESFLVSLPGVGKKVARCVMLYSLDRDVFPVDTHCWRIFCRLGWMPSGNRNGLCSDKEMDIIQDLIPAECRFSLHVNMVSLGRKICRAKGPLCEKCPIMGLCSKIGVV